LATQRSFIRQRHLDPVGRFQVLLTLLVSWYVHGACTSADLGQFGVNLLAA